MRYEPLPAGMPEARNAVVKYYAARGHDVAADRILLTASTSEGYAYLFKLLADPGDHVLVPRPSYPLFEFLATMENIAVRQYPLAYHGGWSIEVEALAAMITERTRAIVLVNPNNPTGSFAGRAERDALSKLGVPLISDEVFADYSFAGKFETLVDTADCLTFSMSGLSKVAGLPQMKLGWIVVSGPEAQRREAMEKLEWIADTYLSVGAPVQCAAASLLEAGDSVQRQIRTRTAANLAFARETFAGTAADVLLGAGGVVHRREGSPCANGRGVGDGTPRAGRRAGPAGILLRLRVGGVPGCQPADSPGGVSRGSREAEGDGWELIPAATAAASATTAGGLGRG